MATFFFLLLLGLINFARPQTVGLGTTGAWNPKPVALGITGTWKPGTPPPTAAPRPPPPPPTAVPPPPTVQPPPPTRPFTTLTATPASTSPCSHDQGLVEFCRQDGRLVLRSPSHVRRLVLGKVVDSKVAETKTLDLAALNLRRLRAKVFDDNTTTCRITADQTDVVRVTELSGLGLDDNDSWYAVCAEYTPMTTSSQKEVANVLRFSLERWEMSSLLVNVQMFTKVNCHRCTVLNPRNAEKLIVAGWNRPNPRLLAVDDLPFAFAHISARVNDAKAKRRVLNYAQTVFPSQMVYVQVPFTGVVGQHSLLADVTPLNSKGAQVLVDGNPLILYDHVRVERIAGKPTKPPKPSPNWTTTGPPLKPMDWWPTYEPSKPLDYWPTTDPGYY